MNLLKWKFLDCKNASKMPVYTPNIVKLVAFLVAPNNVFLTALIPKHDPKY